MCVLQGFGLIDTPHCVHTQTGYGPDGGNILFLGPRRIEPGKPFVLRLAPFTWNANDTVTIYRVGASESEIDASPCVADISIVDYVKGCVKFSGDAVPTEPGSYVVRYKSGRTNTPVGQTTLAVGDSDLPVADVYPLVRWSAGTFARACVYVSRPRCATSPTLPPSLPDAATWDRARPA